MYKDELYKIMDNAEGLSKEEIYKMVDKYADLMQKVMDTINETDQDLYNDVTLCLYEMANGETLTQEMAQNWVENMQPYGEKWTFDDIKKAVNIDLTNEMLIAYYVYMNMYYNDFYNTIRDNIPMYVNLAKNKIEDIDKPENYLYKEFKMYY